MAEQRNQEHFLIDDNQYATGRDQFQRIDSEGNNNDDDGELLFKKGSQEKKKNNLSRSGITQNQYDVSKTTQSIINLPDDWNFNIQPLEEVEDTIKRPETIPEKDYFPELESLKYPMVSRLVIFGIATSVFTLTITLICVLCFRWKENTIWWSTGGALMFSLFFIAYVSYDKQKFDKASQEYERKSFNARQVDEEKAQQQYEAYQAKVQERNEYLIMLNHIKRQSKIIISDNNASDSLKLIETSLDASIQKIWPQKQIFCQKYFEKELQSAQNYNKLDTQSKVGVIQEIFSSYLYVYWMLHRGKHYRGSKLQQIKMTNEVKELYHSIKNFLKRDIVCHQIAQIANLHIKKQEKMYTEDSVRRVFFTLKLKNSYGKGKAVIYEKTVNEVQRLYKFVTATAQNPKYVRCMQLSTVIDKNEILSKDDFRQNKRKYAPEQLKPHQKPRQSAQKMPIKKAMTVKYEDQRQDEFKERLEKQKTAFNESDKGEEITIKRKPTIQLEKEDKLRKQRELEEQQRTQEQENEMEFDSGIKRKPTKHLEVDDNQDSIRPSPSKLSPSKAAKKFIKDNKGDYQKDYVVSEGSSVSMT